MYFIGGTDTTKTFYSKKVFKFDIIARSVDEVKHMSIGRAGFCLAYFNVRIKIVKKLKRIGQTVCLRWIYEGRRISRDRGIHEFQGSFCWMDDYRSDEREEKRSLLMGRQDQ